MSLYSELRRHNVFSVSIAYIVVFWLLLQVLDIVPPLLHLPTWVGTFFLLLLAVGFVPAVIFGWAVELTTKGIRRVHELARSHTRAQPSGRKLGFLIIRPFR